MTTSAAEGTFARNEAAKYFYTATGMGTRPTAWYVSLHTTDPTVDGSVGEVSGSSYARQTVAWTRTNNQVVNTSGITFPTVTTSGYTVAWYGVWDAVTTGNMLARCALPVAKSLAVGDAATFAASEIIITQT